MDKHKRQMAPTLDGIRDDHLERYRFAAFRVKSHQYATGRTPIILDAGSGCGYGSYMLAVDTGSRVISIDSEPSGLAYAQEHYAHPNISHILHDLSDRRPPFAHVVVAFEVLEHFKKAAKFLRTVRSDGAELLIGSVPNELTIPYDKEKHPWHVRHYTPGEIRAFLEGAGFKVLFLRGQKGKKGDDATILPQNVDKARTLVFAAMADE